MRSPRGAPLPSSLLLGFSCVFRWKVLKSLVSWPGFYREFLGSPVIPVARYAVDDDPGCTALQPPRGQLQCRQRGLNLLCSSRWAQGWVTGVRDRVGFGGHRGRRSCHLGQHSQGAPRGPPKGSTAKGTPQRAAPPWHGDTLQCHTACPKCPPPPPAEEQKPAPATPHSSLCS